MLKSISLKNFKCFENLELPLKSVNVLTGVNGMGKSTVIQSLLLLRQSYRENGLTKGLKLNGEYLRLGNGQDILYEKAEEDKFEIDIENENGIHLYQFNYASEDELQPIEQPKTEQEISDNRELFGNQFVYLSAYRIDSKDLYGITDEGKLKKRELGRTGEYAFQYLSQYGADDIRNEAVIMKENDNYSLANQVKVWMDVISPGVMPQIKVDKQLRTSEVRYEYIEGREKTSAYRSANVGFGITYVLPIVIALLSAQKGDLIILENPEAHIHPQGQRMLGELIARAGSGNAQIIVETHSDHILNGIRVAAKQKRVCAEDVNLFYFYKDDETFEHKVKIPTLYQDGRISEWPKGFFDEWENALMELL